MNVVVYTAIFGEYDDLMDPYFTQQGVRLVCLTDAPGTASGSWEVRVVKREFDDPARDARMRKVLAHRMFPDADITVWVDANLQLIKAFSEKQACEVLGQAQMAVHRHDSRTCAYDEADVAIEMGLDDRRVAAHQMARYRREGFPEKEGLVSSGFLVRRRCSANDAFNEAWWSEISGGSRRDQLSFNYCAWKMGTRVSWIPGNVWSGRMFLHRVHKERK